MRNTSTFSAPIHLPAGVARALIVVAHPAQPSLSHSIAGHIAEELAQRGAEVEIADLHLEGFSPAMTAADVALYRGIGTVPADIVREQARIDRADLLIIAFPVYWWTLMPLQKQRCFHWVLLREYSSLPLCRDFF